MDHMPYLKKFYTTCSISYILYSIFILYLICCMLHVILHVTYYILHLSYAWHMTYSDMWHMTCDILHITYLLYKLFHIYRDRSHNYIIWYLYIMCIVHWIHIYHVSYIFIYTYIPSRLHDIGWHRAMLQGYLDVLTCARGTRAEDDLQPPPCRLDAWKKRGHHLPKTAMISSRISFSLSK